MLQFPPMNGEDKTQLHNLHYYSVVSEMDNTYKLG